MRVMTVENMQDHKALACEKCGSVNYALLQSGWIECNKCQDRMGHWLTSPINPNTEEDVRRERIAAIEKLKRDKDFMIEAVEHIAYICKDIPDVAAVIPEPSHFLEMRVIKHTVNQMMKVCA